MSRCPSRRAAELEAVGRLRPYRLVTEMLRVNSLLLKALGRQSLHFLEHAAAGIQRILPHVAVGNWSEVPWEDSDTQWTSPTRTAIRMTIAAQPSDACPHRSVTATVSRRQVPGVGRSAGPRLISASIRSATP